MDSKYSSLTHRPFDVWKMIIIICCLSTFYLLFLTSYQLIEHQHKAHQRKDQVIILLQQLELKLKNSTVYQHSIGEDLSNDVELAIRPKRQVDFSCGMECDSRGRCKVKACLSVGIPSWQDIKEGFIELFD